ncbi:selenocysteine insertion sequence-binding protein 2-like isoform X1 [Thunnus albacares]|uniref:selenocysteine insertion sequence-binding protein 2-like isoform X1 n=2 Tax=Thunnus albacares TaxID=8236 RepID=UPI001CF65FC5|nr:selenocysteine insertion sequence-binding protein 2-like isoform X1 [Thunnus albacares]
MGTLTSIKSFDRKHQRRQRNEPAEPHTASSSPLMLPNPYATDRSSRGSRSGLSPKRNPSNINGVPAGKGGDVPRSHGYSSSRRAARDTSGDLQQRDKSIRDQQAKTSKNNNDSLAQGRTTGKSSMDVQKRGFRGARSATNSAGRTKPAQTDLVPFEVKMADFPELAGVSLGRAGPPLVQKECWGPNPPSVSPQTQKSVSPWKTGRRGSPTQPDPQQSATDAKPDSSAVPPGQPVVTSWANVASQPPKKPVTKEATNSSNHMQTEDMAAQQEEGASGKKKRKKKKKKAKGAGEDVEAESEEPAVYQEPPKFEDEEEFPGLSLASTGTAKLCNEENQREGVQPQFADQNKEKTPAAKTPIETAKKGQKAEKISGKKSKVPVQLDIGNMLAVLEKKQQSQKAKQDAKQVISVGGGLPVVHMQPSVQKKPPWQQDKIAHNPLDSTSPLVKKGKQREVPKAKKPTPLKKVILKEREERKQRRLLEERGLLPEDESKPANDAIEEEQCGANLTDEDVSPVAGDDDLPELNDTDQMVTEGDGESNKDELVEEQTTSAVPCSTVEEQTTSAVPCSTVEEQTTSAVPCSTNRPKIHSRKFRDYCSQMLSKDVDECVTALLKELVRFQDRLYQKDPMKARMKRRLVMGLREVLKHLKLRKVKCVIISPNCERIQSKGGLDEALHTIIDTCREQGVPFVFALSRKALGRCVNKAVPVSLVGIFNYDGAQDYYHKMIELSSEARKAYEVMVSSLEQTNQSDAEQAANIEINELSLSEEPDPNTTQQEEPEYIKIWKKMLEKECNHTFLNFEKQLSSMRLDSECYENTDEDENS